MCTLGQHRVKYGDIQLLTMHSTIPSIYSSVHQLIMLIPSITGVL